MKFLFVKFLLVFGLLTSGILSPFPSQAFDLSTLDVVPKPEVPPTKKGLSQEDRKAIENLITLLESKPNRQILIQELKGLLIAEKKISQGTSSSQFGLLTISEALHSISSKIIEFFDEVQGSCHRLSTYMDEPDLKDNIFNTIYLILSVLGAGFLIDYGLRIAHPFLRKLLLVTARKAHSHRKGLIIRASLYEALIVFLLFILMTISSYSYKLKGIPDLIYQKIIIIVFFYIICLHILRIIFSYDRKWIHFFSFQQDTNKLAYRYLRFIALTTVLGLGLSEIITAVKGPDIFYATAIKTMLLSQCIWTIVFVTRVKDRVKNWLLSSSQKILDKQGHSFASTAARTWHVLAIFYVLLFSLTIYFQTINNMKEVVISFGSTALLVSVGYLIVLKLPVISYSIIGHFVKSFPHLAPRHHFYTIFSSLIFGTFILMTALYFAFKIWDIETVDFLFSEGVKPVFVTLLNIFIIISLGVFIWEANEYLIQRIFNKDRKNYKNKAQRQRLATMLPLIQTIARCFILGIFLIMIFSELKLDVTPLLAGIGVAGLAFTFGSQSLVKDFITGFFILIEDTINVGDIIQLENQKGTVEALSLRTVKLRDTAGNLHTIPFSSINRVTNMTKNFAYYVIELIIPFEQDMESVLQAIQNIDEDLRKDPNFKDHILHPVEIMGIDRFSELGATVMARIKTAPDSHRWRVGREFNLRIQKIFNKLDIQLSVTIHKTEGKPVKESPLLSHSLLEEIETDV